MADDTPELGRLVVLHQALLELILTSKKVRDTAVWDDGAREIAKEADALTMRIAHRTRSAQHYHNTIRGQAALEDAQQIVEAIRANKIHRSENPAGLTDSTWVELVHYVWDKDQLDSPLQQMHSQPSRKITTRWYVDPNMRFISEELR